MTTSKEIDEWCGVLSALLIRSASRTMTDDEVKQAIGVVGGLLATALQDMHRMADALEYTASVQQTMLVMQKEQHDEIMKQAQALGN